MASFDIKVNTSEMESVVSKLEEDVTNLNDAINKMKKGVEDLNQTWEGNNHDEFVKKFDGRYEDIEKFTKSLEKYTNILRLVKESYAKVDSDINAMI